MQYKNQVSLKVLTVFFLLSIFSKAYKKYLLFTVYSVRSNGEFTLNKEIN